MQYLCIVEINAQNKIVDVNVFSETAPLDHKMYVKLDNGVIKAAITAAQKLCENEDDFENTSFVMAVRNPKDAESYAYGFGVFYAGEEYQDYVNSAVKELQDALDEKPGLFKTALDFEKSQASKNKTQ